MSPRVIFLKCKSDGISDALPSKQFSNFHCLLNRNQTPSLAKQLFVIKHLAEALAILNNFQFSKIALPSHPTQHLNMLHTWPRMLSLIPVYLEGLLILQDPAQSSPPETFLIYPLKLD